MTKKLETNHHKSLFWKSFVQTSEPKMFFSPRSFDVEHRLRFFFLSVCEILISETPVQRPPSAFVDVSHRYDLLHSKERFVTHLQVADVFHLLPLQHCGMKTEHRREYDLTFMNNNKHTYSALNQSFQRSFPQPRKIKVALTVNTLEPQIHVGKMCIDTPPTSKRLSDDQMTGNRTLTIPWKGSYYVFPKKSPDNPSSPTWKILRTPMTS